ncbi:DinB family protein [Rossellomorea marisflavi]|uniref:DinB family protein n=1 Tax=Rossellomorea marisflavi TaxID=189381 RepID=UPI00296E978D|nr:DinB family protein [Rossellomorea marisflavi]MDW4528047.1 DinB family protein [Rossellomorea marisflavi]
MISKDLLIRMLDHTYDLESWYAPFKDAVSGVTVSMAVWKPEGSAMNSIWENVNHLTYYKERHAAKLLGEPWEKPLDGHDTFQLTEPREDEAAWKALVDRAERAQGRLKAILQGMSEEEMKENEVAEYLYHILIHDAYHTGQIMQSRKMQGGWPATR